MSNSDLVTPKRGEIWQVDFDPVRGAEITKMRPAVVISADAIGKLPIKLVAPVTGWQLGFEHNIWHVNLTPDSLNKLTKPSAVDVLQLRGVDIQRFVNYVGRLTSSTMEETTAAIAAVIEYQ